MQYEMQINNNEYVELTNKLFAEIADEGWLEQLEEFYNKKFNKTNFVYTKLKLTNDDKLGLINFNEDVVEKFNSLDIELKSKGTYPFEKLDFIDYDNGIVYIIKIKSSKQ